MAYTIDGEMEFNEDKSEAVIRVATSDGKSLTSQEVLDCVSDMLMMHLGWEHQMRSAPATREHDA